ncbi:hypothetical protein PFICI_10510 [Pestalotiopsis fici W106-1]|uniref:Uncharacterized protein n=1 Tax=Pestalotiopsis fici (strain W106-1 / CGMCC3.15140) TaxID=1229662 RepID=W3WX45_PESFW|nr:uncharacterized protein PFICI_10510 [Pestalotiopsis fici W106-1]ETS78448.1 hypothetical protein PFICI_10510 [Pestalotiopsis fici W106-1]
MRVKVSQRKRRSCRSRKRRRQNATNKDDGLGNCPTQLRNIHQSGASGTSVNESAIRHVSPSSPRFIVNKVESREAEDIATKDTANQYSFDKERMVGTKSPVDELIRGTSPREATLGLTTIEHGHFDRSTVAKSEYPDIFGLSTDETDKGELSKDNDGWMVLDTPLFLSEDWTWATAHPLFARQGDTTFIRP